MPITFGPELHIKELVEEQRIGADKAKVGRDMIGCAFSRWLLSFAACLRPYLVT